MHQEEMATGCFANRLRSAARAISRHYDAMLKPLDIKVSQLSVLTAASLGDGQVTIVEMAERLAMDRSTLSRNLDPLERRGLIRVGPEERHRARRIELTPAGAALLEAAYPIWRQAQQSLADTSEQLPAIIRQLDPIIERFG